MSPAMTVEERKFPAASGGRHPEPSPHLLVMPGLVPGTHVFSEGEASYE